MLCRERQQGQTEAKLLLDNVPNRSFTTSSPLTLPTLHPLPAGHVHGRVSAVQAKGLRDCSLAAAARLAAGAVAGVAALRVQPLAGLGAHHGHVLQVVRVAAPGGE